MKIITKNEFSYVPCLMCEFFLQNLIIKRMKRDNAATHVKKLSTDGRGAGDESRFDIKQDIDFHLGDSHPQSVKNWCNAGLGVEPSLARYSLATSRTSVLVMIWFDVGWVQR